MDQDHQQLTFDESMKEVVQALPPVIRAYLAQSKHTPIAKDLMAKYGLRIDQGGVLEREIMLLLMGVESPEEFMQALIEEAKISEDTVNSITEDVNTQILVPLREEEVKESIAGKEVVQSALAAAENRPIEENPRAIHHELPQMVRKESGVGREIPIQKPVQSIPKLIVPIPDMPPRSPDQKMVFPTPTTIPAHDSLVNPPAPVKSYSVDPYREPIE